MHLKDSSGRVLLYGASWWASEEVKEALPTIQQPVWVTMKQQKTELFRCLQRLYYGHAPALDRYDAEMAVLLVILVAEENLPKLLICCSTHFPLSGLLVFLVLTGRGITSSIAMAGH